jgi:hypothetical protein
MFYALLSERSTGWNATTHSYYIGTKGWSVKTQPHETEKEYEWVNGMISNVSILAWSKSKRFWQRYKLKVGEKNSCQGSVVGN